MRQNFCLQIQALGGLLILPTPHVYQVQNIVDGKISTAHVALMVLCLDSSLGLTADNKETFQCLLHRRELKMEGILDLRRLTSG